MKKWYLGAQNDGLFIVDRPPSQSNDHPAHEVNVGLILPVPVGAREFAEAVIAAHNASLDAIRALPPKGWLVTGSKMYEDAVVSTEAMADNRIQSRGASDKSHKIPLVELPPLLT